LQISTRNERKSYNRIQQAANIVNGDEMSFNGEKMEAASREKKKSYWGRRAAFYLLKDLN
jgi:hypothetical protein